MLECLSLGFIVGATAPDRFSGVTNWQFWVYIAIVNLVVMFIYSKIKNLFLY